MFYKKKNIEKNLANGIFDSTLDSFNVISGKRDRDGEKNLVFSRRGPKIRRLIRNLEKFGGANRSCRGWFLNSCQTFSSPIPLLSFFLLPEISDETFLFLFLVEIKNDKRRGRRKWPRDERVQVFPFSERHFFGREQFHKCIWCIRFAFEIKKKKKERKKRKRRKKEEEVVSENTQWDDPFFRVEISIRARVRYVCRGGERFTSSNECFVRARKKKKWARRSDELLRGTSMCHSLSTPRLFFIDSPSL